MPMLDEGTTLDMPVTVPRASVTQAADDLKARDALLRGFPEVEGVVGKAGRAETATDPAPLDMVETFVNFRPRDLWPRRVLRYADAATQTRRVLAPWRNAGFVAPAAGEDRDGLVNDAAQKALERFDEVMRELALRRYQEFETELAPRPWPGSWSPGRCGTRRPAPGRTADEAAFAEAVVAASSDDARRLALSPAEEVVAGAEAGHRRPGRTRVVARPGRRGEVHEVAVAAGVDRSPRGGRPRPADPRGNHAPGHSKPNGRGCGGSG